MAKEILNSQIDLVSEHYVYKGSWIQLFRPLTLTGTLSPVLVGTAFAAKSGTIRLDIFLAILMAALFIQSSTNVLNDYYDFKYGQDNDKWVLAHDAPNGHGPAHKTLPILAGTMITLSIIIGLWLAFANSGSTAWVITTGILGILAGIKYSAGEHSFSSIGLGETTAFLFLGPVITTLAFIVQGNNINWQILILSLPFALLIASMILTNNIRDLKKDIGFRTTLANLLGRTRAVYLLATLLSLAYITVFLLIIYHILPYSALIVFLATPLAGRLILSYRKNAQRSEEIKGMARAAKHHWVFGLLLVFAMWIIG